jgi:hypothetical protein
MVRLYDPVHGRIRCGSEDIRNIHPSTRVHRYASGDPDFKLAEHSTGGGVHCALTDSSLTRVSVAIQFASQVLPPSSENACSK